MAVCRQAGMEANAGHSEAKSANCFILTQHITYDTENTNKLNRNTETENTVRYDGKEKKKRK